MRKLPTMVLSILLVLALVLTGCNSKESAGSEKKDSSNGEKADLRILWPGTNEAEKKVATMLGEKVKAKYPGINIEFLFLNWTDIEKKMTVMVQSGDAPDLMLIQDITNPVAMDALEPLDSYLNDQVNEGKFLKPTWETMKKNDTLYGIPGLAITYSHVANTELLAEAGVKIEDLKTWDDFIKASQAITKTGKSGYSMANGGEGRFTFRDFMMVSLSNGITPDQVDDEHKKQYIEVLELFQELSKDMPKSQVTWLYPELFKAWEAGDIGFMHTGSFFTSNVLAHGTKAMDRTEPIVFPAGPSAENPQMMVGTVGISILKGSKNKEAAWKVVEELMTPEVLGQWGGTVNSSAGTFVDMAILEEAAKGEYPDVYKQHSALNEKWGKLADQYGVPIPSILGQQQMEKIVQGALINLLDGKATPEETYDVIKTGVDKIKAQFK
ncbi:extracellular solute-binding protein [Neobacillus niacini]|uniref:ABC transporter substrate-binding protein n=1 Tax=Neobacillus niacini TaxID=86668 RepID=UPI002FFEF32C